MTEKSSVKLASNIMLKSKYKKDPHGYISYQVFPDYYHDSRVVCNLTPQQQLQNTKSLFYAEKIIDEDDE